MVSSPPANITQTTLPTELHRHIIQNLEGDLNSLCATALTSRNLQLEAERLIYRCMVHRKASIHEKFLSCVLQSPRRALLVNAYSHEGLPYESKLRLWSLLCLALEVMKNLKDLFLSTALLTTSSAFHGQYDIQLESLECRGPYTGNQALLDFLQLQGQLRRLAIEWPQDQSSLILPSTCPKLKYLRGNRGAIEAFLPGRSISSLYWRNNHAESLNSLSHLAPYFNNVKYLSFGGMAEHPNIDLTNIVGSLRNLEVLKILDPTAAEIALTSQLRNLQILFILCQYPRRSYPQQPFEDLYQVTHNTFTACPALQSIYTSVSAQRYNHWIRGHHLHQPTLIGFREVKHRWWEVTAVEQHTRQYGTRNVAFTQRRPNGPYQWAKRSEFGERFA